MSDGSSVTPSAAPASGGAAGRMGLGVLASTFLRSLTIQGSWNYRSMQGGGFAFALLPVLRRLCGESGPTLDAALARHSQHFNSHPYLVGIALGAAARLELEGETPETVDRFKAAIRGPLGGLGDTLVWAGWLPVTLLVALTLAWSGLPPLASVIAFLVLYNVGHLGLRAWSFQVGLREGRAVGSRLRALALGHRAEVLYRVGTLLLGTLSGLLLTSSTAMGGTGWFWPVLAVSGFAVGAFGGPRVWRPTALVVVGVVFVNLVWGAMLPGRVGL